MHTVRQEISQLPASERAFVDALATAAGQYHINPLRAQHLFGMMARQFADIAVARHPEVDWRDAVQGYVDAYAAGLGGTSDIEFVDPPDGALQ